MLMMPLTGNMLHSQFLNALSIQASLISAPKGEVFGYNRDLKPALTWSAVQQNLRDRA
jgi:hypothetical protein